MDYRVTPENDNIEKVGYVRGSVKNTVFYQYKNLRND